jgi:membrane-associated phospholipid phosphatase
MVDTKEIVKNGAAALDDVDAAVAEAALPVRHSALVRTIGALSEIGDQPEMRSLCGALIGVGALTGQRRMLRAGARRLLAHALATAVKSAVQRRVDRTRPRSLGEDRATELRPGLDTDKEESSFPSGHSAGAAATARAFAREYPELKTAAYVGGGLVAVAQIPRCAHYPTDVGAGLAIGIASEAVIHGLFSLVVPEVTEAG